jgi:hypothetical protein
MPNYRTNNRQQQRKPVVPSAPVVERPGPEVGPDGKKDWTRYNMTTVGWAPTPPGAAAHPRELPGVAEARARGLAAEAEYLASRKTYAYKNDDDGWQRVVRKTRRSKRNDDRLHEED